MYHPHIHKTHTITATQHHPPPPIPPHPPAVAPAVSAQRQAKCMLMRARPMVEPHSFWEEMAFNNGGPQGDFAQSSAPLWKTHLIHCCACALLLSCSFFSIREQAPEKTLASVFMRVDGGVLGMQRAPSFLYYTISELDIAKLHLAFPLCLSLLFCLCLCWDKCPQKYVKLDYMHFKQMISSGSPGPKYFKDEMNLKYEREYFLSGLTFFLKLSFFWVIIKTIN